VQVVSLVLAGELTLLSDERVLGEYREVLSRPRFGFAPELIDGVLQQMEADGHLVADAPYRFRKLHSGMGSDSTVTSSRFLRALPPEREPSRRSLGPRSPRSVAWKSAIEPPTASR